MTDSNPRLYSFDGAGVYSKSIGVPCPELDAFVDDMNGVLEKHGIGLELDGDEYGQRIILVPFTSHQEEFFTRALDEYRYGISWLDAARAAFVEANRTEAERKRLREIEEAKRAEEARQARLALAEQARKEALIREGMMIDGKRYALVEVHRPNACKDCGQVGGLTEGANFSYLSSDSCKACGLRLP